MLYLVIDIVDNVIYDSILIDKVNYMSGFFHPPHSEASTELLLARQQAEQIFEHLHLLMHQYRNLQYQALKESGSALSHQEHKALGFFKRHPGATLSDLVEHSGRDKAQLTRLIKGLRDRGLLLAQPHPHDKRSTCLTLSEEAKTVLNRLQQQIQQVNLQAVQTLALDERQQLLRALDKIKHCLQP